MSSFVGFEEDERILKLDGKIEWTDDLISKMNGEVRKRVMPYYDEITKSL